MSYTLDVAETIRKQLYGMDTNLMWGLGAHHFIARTNEKNQPTLTFTVKGAKHKGFVDISLNEGEDLYEVRIYTIRKVKNSLNYKTTIKYETTGIFFDFLPDLLETHCW